MSEVPDETFVHPDAAGRSAHELTPEERDAFSRFAVGPFIGQHKASTVKEHFEYFLGEAARIAVEMELGTWRDPKSGKLQAGGHYSKRKIGQLMGFNNADAHLPSFLEEPGFTRAVQWERVKREAEMRMSAQTVKPMVSVFVGAAMTELLNRILNHPERVRDRELVTETRKYIEMLVAWDAGSEKKPHIQQTLILLQQNIKGLPASSRKKVQQMLGRELSRGMDSIRQLTTEIVPDAEVIA